MPTPLAAALATLSLLLQRDYPRSWKKLKPPAPAASFARLAADLGSPLPPDLLAFYRWRDGASELFGDDEGANDWLSLSEACSILRMLRKTCGASFPATLVPFATDDAGNFACLDAVTSAVVDWDHETRKTKKLYPSLAKMIEREVIAPVRKKRWRNGPELSGDAAKALADKQVKTALTLLAKGSFERAGSIATTLYSKRKYLLARAVCAAAFKELPAAIPFVQRQAGVEFLRVEAWCCQSLGLAAERERAEKLQKTLKKTSVFSQAMLKQLARPL